MAIACKENYLSCVNLPEFEIHLYLTRIFACLIRNSPESKNFYLVFFRIKREAPVAVLGTEDEHVVQNVAGLQEEQTQAAAHTSSSLVPWPASDFDLNLTDIFKLRTTFSPSLEAKHFQLTILERNSSHLMAFLKT